MVELGAIALDLVINLLAGVIQEGVAYSTLPFFERRRIERRIEDAVAEVVEPLMPFLTHENISEDKQLRLIQTCVDELRPLSGNPQIFFQGSLDGEKVFEELYLGRELPQVVIEDDTKDVYALLCPRIATILCKIPAAVKDWENQAWAENYRRLDELSGQLRRLFMVVDELATSRSRQSDETLSIVRRTLAQKIRLELDITGLRADSPLSGKFDDFFIHPELKEMSADGRPQQAVIETLDESFSQFTHPYHQSIIVGSAGSGKSTWTKWLQRETLTARWNGIGIRIELRRFSDEEPLSLQDLVRESAGRHLAEEITTERVGRWLDEKQVVFVLDGFDEVQLDKRDMVFDWIVDMKEAAQGCPILITSRPLTSDHLDRFSDVWQHWTIEPFDHSRIVDYIQRWHANAPLLTDEDRNTDVADLAERWRSDSTIRPLTGNPLLLSTLLMVHHLDGDLPNGRAQLYRRYVDGMLGLWDDRRHVSATTVQLTLVEKRQILRAFALELFSRQQEQVEESAVLDWLQDYLQQTRISYSATEVLALLRERSGLIAGPSTYSFTHKSIAEYMMAENVLQGDRRDTNGARIDRLSLFDHRDDDRWNTVTFLWAGLAPLVDVEEFLQACINAESLALAYGILFDQYERFMPEIRRQLVLELVGKGEFPQQHGMSSSYHLFGLAACHPTHLFPKIPYIEPYTPNPVLRSVGELVTIATFFYRVISDQMITWTDLINERGLVRDVFWVALSSNPGNMDSWRACLASPLPETGQSSLWLYAVAEASFTSAALQDTLDLDVVLTTFQDVCHQALGLVPLAIMSSTITLLHWKHDPVEEPLKCDRIYKLIELLPNSDQGQVIPEWLIGTHTWNFDSAAPYVRRFGQVDLLEFYIQQIEKITIEHSGNRDAHERAIVFVQELQDRREAIERQELSEPAN